MRLIPKPLGVFQCVDVEVVPPCNLVASLVKLAVMTATERDGELVADFEAQSPWLGKTKVVRIGRLTAADEAGLGRYIA